jgi:cyclic pyranopterin phosphate synthase
MSDEDGNDRELEVVRPMHNTEFCDNCTRLRVTSDGRIKPCLMHNEGLVDVLRPLRDGAGDGELSSLFRRAIGFRRPFWE